MCVLTVASGARRDVSCSTATSLLPVSLAHNTLYPINTSTVDQWQPATALLDVLTMSGKSVAADSLPVPAEQNSLISQSCHSLLPCSSVNALFTAATHFLPVTGTDSVSARRRLIGCLQRTNSPMTGVVSLQSPPLATH